MQFNGIIYLHPIKNYLAVLNLILTSILDIRINYLFCLGTIFSRDINIFDLLIILYNILCGCYWKIKNELISCIANFLPVIIHLIIILIMTCSAEGEIFIKTFCLLLVIIIFIPVIFLYIAESIALKILGIFIVITSFSKILIAADDINSFLKKKDYHSFVDLTIPFLGFICYGGWLLFGMIIGDLYCIISNAIICLVWMICIYFNCRNKYNKKEKDKRDKNKNAQIKNIQNSETELKDEE